ncbi:MAG: hypothetical protein JW780_04930, partial [Clostridiales bacterium]|nr:hypothetical protein [Clostridiales bacterium]
SGCRGKRMREGVSSYADGTEKPTGNHPKGADISKFTKQEIKRIEQWLNTYPRKILDYRTPQEAYDRVA